jgi:acetyl esterase/lipase
MPNVDRRTVLSAGVLGVAAPALAQPPADPTEVVTLWPGRPPSALAQLPQEEVVDRVKTSGFRDRFVTGIAAPRMTVFRPARPNGAAALVIPGGGYIRVVIDKEGDEIARRLNAAGVTAFVLRYRLPREGWAEPALVSLQDVQRAMRLIRAGTARFGIDAKRVAALGCSAGGHVSASLATRHADKVYPPVDAADQLSARPDLSALLYPVIEMSQPFAHSGSREALLGPSPTPEAEAANTPWRRITADTPPTFIVHALDDPSVPPENSLAYLAALRATKVPAEAHLFEEGGHGFGIRLAGDKPCAAWPDLFQTWLDRHGFFKA